jgi:hypothetical protein
LSVVKNPTDEEFKEVVRASYRSTFPYVARCRAHCSVEITLDRFVKMTADVAYHSFRIANRCVQKLRKKLALEEQAAESDEDLLPFDNGMAEQGKLHHDPSKHLKKGRDRMPSFYTTRSLHNLSELGTIVDPPPPLVAAAATPDQPSATNTANVTVPALNLGVRDFCPTNVESNIHTYQYPTAREGDAEWELGGATLRSPRSPRDSMTMTGRQGSSLDRVDISSVTAREESHQPPLMRRCVVLAVKRALSNKVVIRRNSSMAKFYYQNAPQQQTET